MLRSGDKDSNAMALWVEVMCDQQSRPPPSVPPRQAALKILSNYSSVRSALDWSQFVDNYVFN